LKREDNPFLSFFARFYIPFAYMQTSLMDDLASEGDYSWKSYDGHLLKKTVREGILSEGACGVNVIAVVHVEAKVKSIEAPFASTRISNDPLKFTVGAKRVAPGLDYAVATMCKGERAIVTCAAHLADGFPGCPPDVVIEFDVELIDIYRGDDNFHGDGINLPRALLFVLFLVIATLLVRHQHSVENSREKDLYD